MSQLGDPCVLTLSIQLHKGLMLISIKHFKDGLRDFHKM